MLFLRFSDLDLVITISLDLGREGVLKSQNKLFTFGCNSGNPNYSNLLIKKSVISPQRKLGCL